MTNHRVLLEETVDGQDVRGFCPKQEIVLQTLITCEESVELDVSQWESIGFLIECNDDNSDNRVWCYVEIPVHYWKLTSAKQPARFVLGASKWKADMTTVDLHCGNGNELVYAATNFDREHKPTIQSVLGRN